MAVRGYGQFCPIARGSEVLAERWTPIILRNVLLGCSTFNAIAAGAPKLSRALLTKRLHELERAGVIEIRPKPHGQGSLYVPTQQGRELWGVLNALGDWAQRWMEVTPDHADPDSVLWSWCHGFLSRDLLPDRRVVVRFEFGIGRGRRSRLWFVLEHGEGEICSFDPGFGDDLVVEIEDPLTFARWHLGLIEWGRALRSGDIRVVGRPDLRRQLPTWNTGPRIHALQRAEHERAPGGKAPLLPGSGPAPGASFPPGGTARPPTESSVVPGFDGQLITPGHPNYDDARAVWNGAVDRRPAYIARCLSPSDVTAALRFGREHNLVIAVRGGGHSVAGTAVCDDGLVIDLGAMKSVQVDPARATATVQAGVRWGELDAATQAFGLATTGGVVSHTGVSGLTLGGGIGWLMRRHGLTVDNLVEAEVVTADGEHRTASVHEDPDLFWGLRGGGGGLGIVTSFTYRLHLVGPEVLAGPVLWALEDAPEILRAYRDFARSAPPEVATIVALRRAPPTPEIPVELHRRPVCMVAMLALGTGDRAERRLAPLRSLGRPLLDLVVHRPYTNLQSMVDASVPHGWHYYWKSTGLSGLDDAVIDTMVDHAARALSPWSYSLLFQLGGAVANCDPDATAYSHRRVPYELNVNAVWLPHQPIGEVEAAWARAFVAGLEPHVAGVYLNFLDHDDRHREPAAFTPASYDRLVELRRRVDPDRVFHHQRGTGDQAS